MSDLKQQLKIMKAQYIMMIFILTQLLMNLTEKNQMKTDMNLKTIRGYINRKIFH